MRGKSYTFFIASTPGKLRKVIVPAYVLHGIAVLALIGSITVMAAVGSYSRMLWKVGNYNALRHDQETLKKQYQQLQSTELLILLLQGFLIVAQRVVSATPEHGHQHQPAPGFSAV